VTPPLKLGVGATGHDEIDLNEHEEIYDEVTGMKLPPDLVTAARQKELKYLKGFPVYEEVP